MEQNLFLCFISDCCKHLCSYYTYPVVIEINSCNLSNIEVKLKQHCRENKIRKDNILKV